MSHPYREVTPTSTGGRSWFTPRAWYWRYKAGIIDWQREDVRRTVGGEYIKIHRIDVAIERNFGVCGFMDLIDNGIRFAWVPRWLCHPATRYLEREYHE